jgi:aminoglycoside phosphotransferase (APT) family kinase protein
MAEPASHILDRLRHDGMVSQHAVSKPLAGGISSDVFLIEDKGERFVVKQALPCLKVQDHWPADTARNRVEYEFLRYLSRVLPEAAPKVIAIGGGYFVMEYLGSEYESWKTLLLRGDCQQQHAVKVGKILGTLHRTSFSNPELASFFDTTSNFHQLRTDPYLLTTGRRHSAVQHIFEREALRLEATRECLVHGDYSPKNMLVGKGRMVLLDCEVGWYGDPAFDVAFLINHLLLKSLFHAPQTTRLQPMIEVFLAKYYEERAVDLAHQKNLDSRIARLLPMLMLARIDGKSPVEYLTKEQQRDFVRNFVYSKLLAQRSELDQVVCEWFSSLPSQFRK